MCSSYWKAGNKALHVKIFHLFTILSVSLKLYFSINPLTFRSKHNVTKPAIATVRW